MVIYVDVLFVVNFFITYLLLLLTGRLAHREAKQLRLVVSSAAGGIYSLVIIADDFGFLLSAIGKTVASVLLVLIAFGFKRVGVWLKAYVIFLFSNALLLGVICAGCLIFKPQGIALNNGTIYFDISAKMLLSCALAAYLLSTVVIKIHNKTVRRDEIYSVTVLKNGDEHHFFAFADSGNKLREPFTDYPVIIVDKDKISYPCERVIPYNTVSGEGVLQAFKPDSVIIKNGKSTVEASCVYIALGDVSSKDFSAILSDELIKNN